jgi:hypothetical protein
MSKHLLTPVTGAGSSHCHFCERKLPIMQKLLGFGFCNLSHKSAYARQQQEMFLARLNMCTDSPIAGAPLRPPMIVPANIEPIPFSSFIKC